MSSSAGTTHALKIGGERVETGEWMEVRSPYDGHTVGRVAWGGAAEARRAVDAAALAMAQPLPAYRRAELLYRIAELLRSRRDDFARTIAAEAGKPLKAARVEADRAVATYTFSAVEVQKLTGETIPMDASEAGVGKIGFTMKVPVGVVGAITPFNFPLNLVAHKLGPALAAGCAVVLKPATQTPCSAIALAELHEEADVPPGWLNVVVGPAAEIGNVLVADDRVRLLTFTGSAEVGWGIRERAARKRVVLELGNSSPVIVEPDADVELAATKVAGGGFLFAGQTCISVQRVYVHRDVYDEFLALLVAKVEALVVGDPADADTDVGPVIDDSSRDRILDWIDQARAGGARVLTGGEAEGRIVRPTVLADIAPSMAISCKEVFGPVVGVAPYDSLDEAFALANGTEYGLQAAIFTRDVTRALRAAAALEFGGIVVNDAPSFRADNMPYGGVKSSGNTKEGPAYAVREMTEDRLVLIQT